MGSFPRLGWNTFLFFFFQHLFIYCVCLYVHAMAPVCMLAGSWFSPIVWLLGILGQGMHTLPFPGRRSTGKHEQTLCSVVCASGGAPITFLVVLVLGVEKKAGAGWVVQWAVQAFKSLQI